MPDTKISYQVTENNEIRIISCAFFFVITPFAKSSM